MFFLMPVLLDDRLSDKLECGYVTTYDLFIADRRKVFRIELCIREKMKNQLSKSIIL